MGLGLVSLGLLDSESANCVMHVKTQYLFSLWESLYHKVLSESPCRRSSKGISNEKSCAIDNFVV